MPAERLSMRKIRDVLRMRFEIRLSERQIARATTLSVGSVNAYLQRARLIVVVAVGGLRLLGQELGGELSYMTRGVLQWRAGAGPSWTGSASGCRWSTLWALIRNGSLALSDFPAPSHPHRMPDVRPSRALQARLPDREVRPRRRPPRHAGGDRGLRAAMGPQSAVRGEVH